MGAGAGVGDVAADEKLGLKPPSASISMSIDDVVVLPWVPATATARAWRTSRRASLPAATWGSRRHGGAQLDVVGRDRRRRRDGVAAVDDGGVVADVDRHAGGAHAVEDRLLAEVAARHRVAHLGEGDGDGAHARPAHADDVETEGAGQVERGGRGRNGVGTTAVTFP